MTFLQIRICFLFGLVVGTLSLPESELWAQAGSTADVHPSRLYVKFSRTDLAMAGGKTGLAIFDKVAVRHNSARREPGTPALSNGPCEIETW